MMAALIKDPVGLLLAVLGNVIGTYPGLLVAQVLAGLTA